jgi:hypothetical protein
VPIFRQVAGWNPFVYNLKTTSMKKIVLTATAAICIACGASAHKTDQPIKIIKWLIWIIKVIANAPPPPTNNSKVMHPAYASTPVGVYPSNPCFGGTYWCLAGFTTAQMTAGGNYLKTTLGNQTPFTAAFTRS